MSTAVLTPESEVAVSRAPAPAGRRALRSPTLVAGALLTLAVVLATIFAPQLATHDPGAQNLTGGLQAPGGEHLLGTDQLGRDVYSRLLFAGRTNLGVAALAAVIPFVTGVLLGTLAGYVGGWLDTVTSRVTDTVVAFPFYVLVIAVVAMVGQGTRGIVLTFAIVGWVGYARVVRATTRTVADADYVRAARDGGLSHLRVAARHVMPATLAQAVVLLVSEIVLIMVAIVTLGYLGLGYDPAIPEWGRMIQDGQPFLTSAWWLSVAPGAVVVVVGIGLSLLADGLGDVWGRR